MTVTQVLGAKVQPTFADPTEWNSTRTYAPLTIVLHEGNSFTSRQYVPVGIDISNTDFWAETGNYNAQVEQYRQVVLSYDDKINNANNKADSALNAAQKKKSIDVYQIANATGSTFTASVVVTDKIGLIDCGTGMVDSVVSFMNENDYQKFNYIVFTHMHVDHVENTISQIAKLKPYVDNDTAIYIQMAPNSTFAQYSTYVLGYDAATSLGPVTVPIDKAPIKLGDTVLTFFNTNPFNIDAYNSYSNLNIFSLICRIDFEGSSYIDCGDVYWDAQNNYTNIGNCDMFKWPHHGVNTWDSYPFISQFAAKAYTTSPGADGKLVTNRDGNVYISKWARQVPYCKGYYQSLNTNTRFTITNGAITTDNACTFIPKRATDIIGFFDIEANQSSNIDDYKNWSISMMMKKLDKLPIGSEICIQHMTDYDGCQFAMQLYAFLLGMCRAEVSSSGFNSIRARKENFVGITQFVFNFESQVVGEMSLIHNYENTIGVLPTFSSYDDVLNKYSTSTPNDNSVKTLVGELFDKYGYISGLPRLSFANIRNTCVFGSYIYGNQSWTDFSKLEFTTNSWMNFAPKTAVILFNEDVGSFTAGSKTSIVFQMGHDNYTATIFKYTHTYNFMINDNHMQIAEDNKVIYDSSSSNAISFISRM